jgi:intracellular multiplication protein IcmK
MKRLLFGLSAAALLGLTCLPASAQGIDEFEKELSAFQKKVDAGKDAPSDAAPQATNEKNSTDTKESSESRIVPAGKERIFAAHLPPDNTDEDKDETASKSGGSPLGPAGNLPLAKQLPATAHAMDLQSPAEMQAQMEAEAEVQKKKLDEATFNDALKQLLPLSPDQIRKVLGAFKDSREASETPVALPVPKVTVETVSLDPSLTPPVIKTAAGRVTTLTILDETGSPWPIQDVSWAGKFEVTPPEEGGHVVRVTPQSAHGVGNISIRLVDLITPITFTLQTGLDEVDYRFDARIPKQGPLAKTPLIEYGGLKTVTGADENLVQILDGTPPGTSEKLKVDGVDGRTNVWRVSGRIYLRTPLTLLSPTWNSSVTSADGMNVYSLNDTPVILLSDEGRMVRAHIAAAEVTP